MRIYKSNQHRGIKLQRDSLYARIRNKARLSRKGKRYNPNKAFLIPHEIRVNRNIKVSGDLNGTKTIDCPENLNFKNDATSTIKFFDEIRNEILKGRTHNVQVNLASLVEISPPAAVALLAELTRCVYYAGKSKKLRGNFPKSERAKQVLSDIGYFRVFGIKAPKTTIPPNSRVYIKTKFGNRSDGRYTHELLAQFEQVCGLSPVGSKRLYGALIECMDNVKGHAYPESLGDRPDLVGEWWMCGFADPLRRQVALVFYDLGEGIPTTIKRKRSIRIKSYLNFTDSRILKQAVEVGLSSKESQRRGTGLPSLREFIDYAPGGFLRVISGTGDIIYKTNSKRITTRQLERPLEGSLIVWTIQEKDGPHSWDEECDLESTQTQIQLRFPNEQTGI